MHKAIGEGSRSPREWDLELLSTVPEKIAGRPEGQVTPGSVVTVAGI